MTVSERVRDQADHSRAATKEAPPKARYVLCVRNEGYEASLELRKVYRSLPDPRSEKHGLRRVVDESGETYLYPKDWFVTVRLAKAAAKLLAP